MARTNAKAAKPGWQLAWGLALVPLLLIAQTIPAWAQEEESLDEEPPPEATQAGVDAATGSGLSEEELKALEGMNQEEVGVGPEVFDEGVEAYYAGSYKDACERLWTYMAGNPPGAKYFGYAEYFLAASLEKLEFSHAALEYYFNVAKDRTKPELLPDALQAIERMTRRYPFDQDLLLKDLIYDTNFGYMRDDLQDFIEYHQGLLDYRNGFIDWGKKHFARIQKGTYYYYKTLYVRAVYELVKHNLDDALALFKEILDSDFDQVDVLNQTRQSMARVLFEKTQFKEAYDMYETINAPVEKQASVFLEEAWAQYYIKDYRRAMGLLYALEAPAFYRYFNPEKFLIRALIYKNLCHYNVAKDAVAEYHMQYGQALDAIYERVDLHENEIILDAALQDPSLMELSAFQRRLDTELGLVGDYDFSWGGSGLVDHLSRIYNLKLLEVNRQIKKLLDEKVREVANQLLIFEEQMNLLEYEIGLDIYKRIKGAPKEYGDKEAQRVPYAGAWVFYEFDGEFWNDELHDYRFFIEDRCFEEERWE